MDATTIVPYDFNLSITERRAEKTDASFRERMTEEMWLKFQPLFEENKRLLNELAACTPNRHVEEIASLEQELAALNGAISEEDRQIKEEQQKTAAAVSTLIAEKTAEVLNCTKTEENNATARIRKEALAAEADQKQALEALGRQRSKDFDDCVIKYGQARDLKIQQYQSTTKSNIQNVGYALKRALTRVQTEIKPNDFYPSLEHAKIAKEWIEEQIQWALTGVEKL